MVIKQPSNPSMHIKRLINEVKQALLLLNKHSPLTGGIKKFRISIWLTIDH